MQVRERDTQRTGYPFFKENLYRKRKGVNKCMN